MKLEDCSILKIGDKVYVKGMCNTLLPCEIVGFDYKSIKYNFLGEPSTEAKKAMYYDIERVMTEEEVKSVLDEARKTKNFKMPKCPDCKKPIDKCKCVE